jgi:hypothetical protein
LWNSSSTIPWKITTISIPITGGSQQKPPSRVDFNMFAFLLLSIVVTKITGLR